MDAATAIAIAAPNAVAATAIVLGWLQHRGRLDQDRRLIDLDNVRDVLDEAALALHRVAYVLDDVRSYLLQYGGASFFKTDDGTMTYKKLGASGGSGDRGETLPS